ncbi:nicotinamide mononucleotide transporter [Pedobacter sp. BS3]|uniref:nicotinamide riboside transporter PnuC n=1 Tax=Pedobacter sp. BS3 TaxID=2567937 RepID=UPI0011ED4DD6|nr:nicotinamide riboside transporter PnuC [Pedobacter sp. BS3]TZF82042.1 nicotinamide mononucleotide transporter [Pedobacter sp. BS3]
MEWQNWYHLLAEQLKETTILQWIAVSLGVAEVLLARVNNVWLYPTGIAGILLSMVLLVEARLYAECLLNVYYVVMSVYGWIYWYRKKNEPPVKISYSTRQEWLITLAIVFGGWVILYLALKHFTDSDVPLIDAWVSSAAWAGMWLLARRKMENWILLNISNFFAVPLLFHKKLPLFALLTIFLFIIAILGYREWKKLYRQERTI